MNESRAVLMCDIVDSTQIARELGDERMADVWRLHDRRARDLLHRLRGIEVDKSDGFLLLFEHVADATGFASAYHTALADLPTPLKARVGVHVGEVTLRSNLPEDIRRGAKPLEVDGLSKSIAARVMSVAAGGQTLLSAAAHAALAPQHSCSHGHWRMKGIEEPLELFEVGDAQAPWTPPVESDKVYRVVRAGDLWLPARDIRHTLPAERDAFVGRRHELLQMARLFASGARLVSVLGAGGGGKTRLALRFGRSWLGDYPGGVWFCDLSQALTQADVVQAVARGLELDLTIDDPVSLVGAAIAGRAQCLVIFDNFEQVVPHAESTLGRWLERAPAARFVVTSRERLRIVGEQALVLEPMPSQDAIALFELRAGAAGGAPIESITERAALDPLVELLDGLPLAIELAAARSRLMPPSLLLRRMEKRFSLLTSAGGRLSRQSTLLATIDWSWELLGAAERSALAQLSVFEGGMSLSAIESVLDIDGRGVEVALVDVLQSLLEKSLVRQLPDGRLAMLRAIHEYAASKLSAIDGGASEADAQRRHFRYFASLGKARAVEQRCIELDNLVVAVRRAVAQADALAADALVAAWAALRLRGPFALALELADRVASIPHLDALSSAKAQLVAGWTLKALGNGKQARQRLDAALQLARAAAHRGVESEVSSLLGVLDTSEGRIGDATKRLEAAMSGAQGCGDALLECQVRSSRGNLLLRCGDLDGAASEYLGALEIARRARDRRWEGGALGNLGLVRHEQGRMHEAREHYGSALAIARELGDRQWEGNTMCNLGLLLHTQGELAEARSQLEGALTLARETGHVSLESIALCNLALVAEASNEPECALPLYEAALRVAHDIGDRRAAGQVQGYLGVLHARQGRMAQARRALTDGESLLREVADRLNLAFVLCARVEAEHLAGDAIAARHALTAAAAAVAEAGGGPESELGGRFAQVRALVDVGQPAASGF